MSLVRPLLVFGVASCVSLAAFQLTGGARGADASTATLTAHPPGPSFQIGVGYDLTALELVESTTYYIDESYVDHNRVDYDNMYTQALEAVEKRVPVCMFTREPGGTMVHVEVGEFRTVLEVPKITSSHDLKRELKKVATILHQNLRPEDVPNDDNPDEEPYAQIEYAMINGMLSTLDPHSTLLPPDDSKEMDTENAGEFGGLGITIATNKENQLTVEYPLPGTPAETAGLKADDEISRIDGVSTINMTLEEAVKRLRGPIDSPVDLEIARSGVSDPIKMHIIRKKIELHPVESDLLDGGVGYIDIAQFHAKVGGDLHERLTELTRRNNGQLKGLIIDLRDNPGGFLNQAVDVADAFLDKGVIVSTVDGDGNKQEEQDAKSNDQDQPRYPIIVLTNSSSASASEIVSGALRNNERAVIVGERTFGKGSVQNLHPFFDGSKLKLTISQYLTPGERSIQSVGIPADIELIPSVVEKDKNDQTHKDENVISLWHTERVKREGDLDKHLDNASTRHEEPSYSIRYLTPAERKQRTTAKLDLSGDFEVQFARDVLLSAASYRRADILGAVGPVVNRYQRQGNKDIEAAFAKLNIDWSDGAAVTQARLSSKLDLGATGELVAGTTQNVAVEVTNNGDQPLYRLAAIATFATDAQPREFFFGKLLPGQTKRYEVPMELVPGHPTEVSPVTLTFRDTSGKDVYVDHARLPVQGKPLPKLAWQLSIDDSAPIGNGDGILQVGEKARLTLEVENVGKGATGQAFARLKDDSGALLDITKGNLEIGSMVDKDGKQCVAIAKAPAATPAPAASGSTAAVSPKAADDSPKYPEGCSLSLAPGQKFTGTFEIAVNQADPKGLDLELDLGDGKIYDQASIVRAGFYTYFTNKQKVHLVVGDKLPTFARSEPPRIDITREPEVVSGDQRVSMSGVVNDDTGIAYVMVYQGTPEAGSPGKDPASEPSPPELDEDKVFFQDSVRGSHIRQVPFTADLAMKPGLNTFTVLATDENGFSDSSSVVTWYQPPESAKAEVAVGPLPQLKRE